MLAILKKTCRDYALMWAATFALIAGFTFLYNTALGSMPIEKSEYFLQLEWVRRLIAAFAGADLLDVMTATGFVSFGLGHPMMWILLIGSLFTFTSGALTAEIDRGTIDIVGTLPFSRTSHYVCVSLAAICIGLPLCAAAWIGLRLGGLGGNAHDLDYGILAVVTCHLFAAYCFLTGLSLGVSAMCSRRTTALLICFLPVFYSFVLNVVGAFWEPAEKAAWTGYLGYYRPLPIVRDGAWQWSDIAVLLVAGAIIWLAGWIVYVRRDFPAR